MFGSLSLPSQSPFTFHRRVSVRSVSEVRPISSVDAVNRCLYEVLRVKQNASPTEIKTAYRTLAKLYHPDANSRFMNSSIAKSSEGQDFIEIHNAYSTLSDPNARAVYDSNLNFNSPRAWKNAGVSGFRSSGRGRFYPTRRWETDQCW